MTQRHSPETAEMVRAGLGQPQTFGIGPSWRRGMMHAVERVDMVLAQKLSATRTVAEIRTVLDELTKLQRDHMPGSYEQAFAICGDDLKRASKRRGAVA